MSEVKNRHDQNGEYPRCKTENKHMGEQNSMGEQTLNGKKSRVTYTTRHRKDDDDDDDNDDRS